MLFSLCSRFLPHEAHVRASSLGGELHLAQALRHSGEFLLPPPNDNVHITLCDRGGRYARIWRLLLIFMVFMVFMVFIVCTGVEDYFGVYTTIHGAHFLFNVRSLTNSLFGLKFNNIKKNKNENIVLFLQIFFCLLQK